MISICCVAYNDLDYLKILYGSIKRNTKIKYEFIVHDNNSEDGTEKWLQQNNIKYSKSEKNEGNPALNYAVEQAKYDYVFLPNADHYLLPQWDVQLIKEIKKFEKEKIKKFIVGYAVIEPGGNNPECPICYCGHDASTFNEQKLLHFYLTDLKNNVKLNTIQYSFPNCLRKDFWDEFGGMDFNYFPSFGCDHDFGIAAYKAGCRHFKLLGSSLCYHFSSGTNRKLPPELKKRHGHDVFFNKWGMTVEEFRKRLKIATPYDILEDDLLNV
jgi:glycosyltransferase involved in cell wall biosynthesis